MKRLFYISLLVLSLSVITSSCFDDDKTENSPTCIIAGFSVGDITSEYKTKNAAGKDTTYNRTMSGSTIKFNIDQLNGVIESVDSLPNWVNITKVVPSVVYSGIIYCRVGGETAEYNYFRSGNDSIDFTKDVMFRVVSSDGNYKRHYSVKIHKSVLEADSLYWTSVSTNLSLNGNHRSLAMGDVIYVFMENDRNTTVTKCDVSQKTLTWDTPQALSTPLNYQSITLFDNKFYGLDYDGYVYGSSDGLSWNKLSTTILDRLLAADSYKLYAFDGSSMVSSTDGVIWTTETVQNLDMLPQMPVSSACYSTKTNKDLQNVVMVGTNLSAEYTPAWFKISSADDESNQNWNYINISNDNNYPMPALKYVQMARFKDMLIAMGGESVDGTIKPYEALYVSEDNGITWHVPEKKMSVLDEWNGSTKCMTLVGCKDYIWVIQSGGKMWKGEMWID